MIRVHPDTAMRLRTIAEAEKRPMSKIVGEALDAYLISHGVTVVIEADASRLVTAMNDAAMTAERVRSSPSDRSEVVPERTFVDERSVWCHWCGAGCEAVDDQPAGGKDRDVSSDAENKKVIGLMANAENKVVDLMADLERSVAEAKAARKRLDSKRRAAHPVRSDAEDGERQACPDPYCRVCKDQDGEVRDGYWC